MISFFIPSILAVSLLSCGHPLEPLGREAHSRLDEAADTITLLKEAKSQASKELLEELRELFDSLTLVSICKPNKQSNNSKVSKIKPSYGLLWKFPPTYKDFDESFDESHCIPLSTLIPIIEIIHPVFKDMQEIEQYYYLLYLKNNQEELEKLFKFPVK